LSSRFGGHKGGVAKGRRGRRGSVRLQFDSPGQLRRFSRATKKVLARSHSRSLQLQAGLDTRTEFEISQRSLKGGGEAGRAHHCTGSSATKYLLVDAGESTEQPQIATKHSLIHSYRRLNQLMHV
jgi:hypothetical protein